MVKRELPSADGASEVLVTWVSASGEKGESKTLAPHEAFGFAGSLYAKHGATGGRATFAYFASEDVSAVVASVATEPAKACSICKGPIAFPELAGDELCDTCAASKNVDHDLTSNPPSTWGETVVDESAKVRIEAMHDKLRASGVALADDPHAAGVQFFATGTRMADSGYQAQEARKAEHDAGKCVADAVHELATVVRDEKRADRIVTAREFADSIEVNGKIRAFGLSLSEHSIRGLLQRIESPSTGYVLGLRQRIAESLAFAGEACDECGSNQTGRHLTTCSRAELARADKSKIAEILRYECHRAGDARVKLRTREADDCRDIFAVVGTGYSPADAPEALAKLADGLPSEARATWSYDKDSTAWELRASVWTTTPVAEQAVGEPFRGYAAFRSKDNGSGRFRGGGGIELLRCLNASVYEAEGAEIARVHRGNVLGDVETMVAKSRAAIDVLCEAWGHNRAHEIEAPANVPIGEAIPGFWRWLLTNEIRKGGLEGVLSGRKEDRVEQMVEAYRGERRDPARLVRADFAQAWTRAIQGEREDVRREAESAIGAWTVANRPIGYDAGK